MPCIIRRRNDYPIAQWAGGATVELFIRPSCARCADRNFAWRVSSATVELDESDFSDFTGFTRHIMPLEGRMRLEHDGRSAVDLRPGEAHTFDGGCKTRSSGRCVDFNLIHVPGLRGALGVARIESAVACVPNGFTGLYVRCDRLRVETRPKGQTVASEETLNAGDFLILETVPGDPRCEIRLKADEDRAPVPAVVVTVSR